MEKLSMDKKTLRKFGITMGIALFIIALLLFFRHKHSPVAVLSISAVWFICAFIAPGILKPLYIGWMKFAFILSWINTRVILFIIFYLIFTPVGVAMRLFGADLLKRKTDKNRDSYWQKAVKKPFDRVSYEKQF